MTEVAEEKNIDLWVSSPNVTQSQLDLLAMFYEATLSNRIGLAHVLNVETGKQELVLAGVEAAPDGIQYYPLAKVLDASEASLYVPLEASEEVTQEND
jgi:hypothetical protein